MEIRSYRPGDLFMLYRICLQTGANGGDATGLIDDDLLGHIYAAPYVLNEPDMCFVVTEGDLPCGYILGTKDSEAFGAYYNGKWLPPLLARYPLPDSVDRSYAATVIRALHSGYRVPDIARDYPAHLHIDLLPVAQGLGMGSKLMQRFLGQLDSSDVPAVHFGVSKSNPRAVEFYEHLGFHRIIETEAGITFGMEI